MLESIGILEVSSVALGYRAEDAMLKAADVRVLLARTICSGKFLVVVTGSVDQATAAVDAGVASLRDGLIDHAVIPRIHGDVFRALHQCVELQVKPAAERQAAVKALGVVETFSATSILEAADAAAKAAAVALLRIHLAMALGGKGMLLLAGAVADVQAAVEAAAAAARGKGLLVAAVTIPGPSRELFAEYV
ncbi:MAG: BMC domain-containing protein [Planctomycetes bacterium]|nr:BMC domain-containing protein [Planctomycetota bacterium]